MVVPAEDGPRAVQRCAFSRCEGDKGGKGHRKEEGCGGGANEVTLLGMSVRGPHNG